MDMLTYMNAVYNFICLAAAVIIPLYSLLFDMCE